MRVIAGSLKGRRLTTPDWPGVRPTSDRLRETLFNVLAGRVVDAIVLDGHAGTGANGLEALSRGARHVTFVDRDRRATALVSENVRRCGVESACAIIRDELERASARLGRGRFDVILLDPPYDGADLARCLEAVQDLLAPSGLIVLEHARRVEAPPVAGPLARRREIRAGDSRLSLYTKSPEPD